MYETLFPFLFRTYYSALPERERSADNCFVEPLVPQNDFLVTTNIDQKYVVEKLSGIFRADSCRLARTLFDEASRVALAILSKLGSARGVIRAPARLVLSNSVRPESSFSRLDGDRKWNFSRGVYFYKVGFWFFAQNILLLIFWNRLYFRRICRFARFARRYFVLNKRINGIRKTFFVWPSQFQRGALLQLNFITTNSCSGSHCTLSANCRTDFADKSHSTRESTQSWKHTLF